MLPELAPMIAEFQQAVSLVLEFLEVIYDGARITSCWANINAPHTGHREHIHPNNYLSAVYYVQADDGANQFTIDDPRPQRHMIKPRVAEFDAVQRGAIQPVGQAGRPSAFSGMAAALGRFQPQQPRPDQHQLQRDVRAFRGDHERAGLERHAQDGTAHQGRLLTGGPTRRSDHFICNGTITTGRRLMNGALRLGPPGAKPSRRLAPRPLPCAPNGRGAGAGSAGRPDG